MVRTFDLKDNTLTTPFLFTFKGRKIVTSGNVDFVQQVKVFGKNWGVATETDKVHPVQEDMDNININAEDKGHVREAFLNRMKESEYPDMIMPQITQYHGVLRSQGNRVVIRDVQAAKFDQEAQFKAAWKRDPAKPKESPYMFWFDYGDIVSPVLVEETAMMYAILLSKFFDCEFVVNRQFDANGKPNASVWKVRDTSRQDRRLDILHNKWRKAERDLTNKGTNAIKEPMALASMAYQHFRLWFNGLKAQGTYTIDLKDPYSQQQFRLLIECISDMLDIDDVAIELPISSPTQSYDVDQLQSIKRALRALESNGLFDKITWVPLPHSYYVQLLKGALQFVPYATKHKYDWDVNKVEKFCLAGEDVAFFGPILEKEPKAISLFHPATGLADSFYRTLRPPERIVMRHMYQDSAIPTATYNELRSQTQGLLSGDFFVPRNWSQTKGAKSMDTVFDVTEKLLQPLWPGQPIPLFARQMVGGAKVMAQAPNSGYSVKLSTTQDLTATPDACFPDVKAIRDELAGYLLPFPATQDMPANILVK